MIPWLVVHSIGIVVCVFGIFGLFSDQLGLIDYPVFKYICGVYIAVLSFYIYCFMAVHSLFENIRDKSQHGPVTRVSQFQMNLNNGKLV